MSSRYQRKSPPVGSVQNTPRRHTRLLVAVVVAVIIGVVLLKTGVIGQQATGSLIAGTSTASNAAGATVTGVPVTPQATTGGIGSSTQGSGGIGPVSIFLLVVYSLVGLLFAFPMLWPPMGRIRTELFLGFTIIAVFDMYTSRETIKFYAMIAMVVFVLRVGRVWMARRASVPGSERDAFHNRMRAIEARLRGLEEDGEGDSRDIQAEIGLINGIRRRAVRMEQMLDEAVRKGEKTEEEAFGEEVRGHWDLLQDYLQSFVDRSEMTRESAADLMEREYDQHPDLSPSSNPFEGIPVRKRD